MFGCVRKGLSNVFRNKLRSFLTIGGIMIGVLSVVVISTIGKVGTVTIDNQLVNMGMDSVVISGDKSNETGLDETDLQKVKSVSQVKNAMPLIYLMGKTDILGQKSECMVWGVNQDADNVISLKAIYGRLINKGDLQSHAKVCVVDEKIALQTYKRSNIVGKTITVSADGVTDEYTVVGVVKNGVNMLQSMFGQFIPYFVYLPYTTLSQEYSQTYFDNIAVKLDKGESSSEISDCLSRAILTERKCNIDLNIENLLRQKTQLEDILGVITKVLSAIAGISLVVSGLSIMTVMLVSVNERTREIGIKKSIGATNGDIMREFLIESVLITFMGGISGSALGIALCSVGCFAFNLKPIIDYLMITRILIFSVAIGLVFGVYPAYRASKLKPVDALRYE